MEGGGVVIICTCWFFRIFNGLLLVLMISKLSVSFGNELILPITVFHAVLKSHSGSGTTWYNVSFRFGELYTLRLGQSCLLPWLAYNSRSVTYIFSCFCCFDNITFLLVSFLSAHRFEFCGGYWYRCGAVEHGLELWWKHFLDKSVNKECSEYNSTRGSFKASNTTWIRVFFNLKSSKTVPVMRTIWLAPLFNDGSRPITSENVYSY